MYQPTDVLRWLVDRANNAELVALVTVMVAGQKISGWLIGYQRYMDALGEHIQANNVPIDRLTQEARGDVGEYIHLQEVERGAQDASPVRSAVTGGLWRIPLEAVEAWSLYPSDPTNRPRLGSERAKRASQK